MKLEVTRGQVFKSGKTYSISVGILENEGVIANGVVLDFFITDLEGNDISNLISISQTSISQGSYSNLSWDVGSHVGNSINGLFDVTLNSDNITGIKIFSALSSDVQDKDPENNFKEWHYYGISYAQLSSIYVDYSITEAFTGKQDDNGDDIYVQGFLFINSDVVQVAAAMEVSIVSSWQPSDFKRVIRHEIQYDYVAAQGTGVQTNPDIRHTTFSGTSVPHYRIVTGPIKTGGHWYIYYTKNP